WIIPIPQILEIRSLVPQPSPDPTSKSARTFIIRTRRRDYTLVAPTPESFRRWTFLLCRLSNTSAQNPEDENWEGQSEFGGEESDDDDGRTQVQGYGMGMEKLVRMGVEGLGGESGPSAGGADLRHQRRRSVMSVRSSMGGSTIIGGIPPTLNANHPSKERLSIWHRALGELTQVDPEAGAMVFSVAIASNGSGGVERGLGALVKSGGFPALRRRSSVASMSGASRGGEDILFKYNNGADVPPVPELPAGVRDRSGSGGVGQRAPSREAEREIEERSPPGDSPPMREQPPRGVAPNDVASVHSSQRDVDGHSVHSGDGLPQRKKSLVRERMMNGGIGLIRQDSVGPGGLKSPGAVNPAMEELMQLESELRGLSRIPTSGVGVETPVRMSPQGVEVNEPREENLKIKPAGSREMLNAPRSPPTPPDAGPAEVLQHFRPQEMNRTSLLSDTSIAEYGFAKPLAPDTHHVPKALTPINESRAPTRESESRSHHSHNQQPPPELSTSPELHAQLQHACDAIIRLTGRLLGSTDGITSPQSLLSQPQKSKTYPSPQFYTRFATQAIPHHARIIHDYVETYVAELESTRTRQRSYTNDSTDAHMDQYMQGRVAGIWKRVDVVGGVRGAFS
ncbi:hypothetical protein HK097_004992, partial [Rhizophlyctis rosea]